MNLKQSINWKKILPYLIGAGVILMLMSAFRSKPIDVDVAKATVAPLSVKIKEEGITKVRNRHVITPPVSGFLNRVTLSEGDQIRQNLTVLATLEPGMPGFLDPRAREETRVRIKAAEALRKLKEAEVERVKTSLDLAQKEYERAEVLDKKNYISKKELDEVKAQVLIHNQELSSAQFALNIADYEVEQLQAKLKEASKMQGDHENDLELVSPVDGHVLKVNDANARYVTAGTPLMEIGNIDDLAVEIEMLSNDAVSIKDGAPVEISQWGGDHHLRGKVSLVEPGAFTRTSSLGVEEQRVRVHVDIVDALPKSYRLGDKYRVEAEVVSWEKDDVLQIPTGAIFRLGSRWMAFVVNNGKAELREVKTGHQNGAQVEVLDGLEEGDVVVVYPPESIDEGTTVNIL